MEQNHHLKTMGTRIKNIRNKRKMTQVEFYRFLFPDSNNSDENIKSTMIKIEHGRTKLLNIDMLLRICSKCEVSADYLLGFADDYTNHEIELICNYTGLEEHAVNQLHDWNTAKNNGADLSKIEEAFWEEEEEEHRKMFKKQDGIAMLRIVNYLFRSGKRKSKRKKGKVEPFYNATILNSLRLMCMERPKRVEATAIIDKYVEAFLMQMNNRNLRYKVEHVSIDLRHPIIMRDNNTVLYVIDPEDTLRRIGKENLDRGIEWLIEQVKLDEKRGYSSNDYT